VRLALIIPNPRLNLLDQVMEVVRLRHYSIRTEHSHMECGGKRSATPLWLERWSDTKHKPQRRRASLAAALHKVP